MNHHELGCRHLIQSECHSFSFYIVVVSDDEPFDDTMLGATVIGDEDTVAQDYIGEWG